MPEIIMTPGGTPRGDRSLSYVPYEMRNIAGRCSKCINAIEMKDEYRRFCGWMCTSDKDMNAEGCDSYETCRR